MNKTVNELNAYLKGEYMAIDSYEKFIQNVQDKEIKEHFQNIQKEHKQHAIKVAERIQTLGGKPVNGVGFSGKIAETFSSIKNIGRKNDDFFVKRAYIGESKGIEMAAEIVKGDLDNHSIKLVNEMMFEDRNHLRVLQNLIKD